MQNPFHNIVGNSNQLIRMNHKWRRINLYYLAPQWQPCLAGVSCYVRHCSYHGHPCQGSDSHDEDNTCVSTETKKKSAIWIF